MGYRNLGKTEDLMRGFGPRKGLEGPFIFVNGRILYYDAKEGEYYDPTTDFYVDRDEMAELHSMLLKVIAR